MYQESEARTLSGVVVLSLLPCLGSESFCCAEGFLQGAAELLCVSAEELETCLSVRMLQAGKHSVVKPCSQAECSTRTNCMAKVIYAQ